MRGVFFAVIDTTSIFSSIGSLHRKQSIIIPLTRQRSDKTKPPYSLSTARGVLTSLNGHEQVKNRVGVLIHLRENVLRGLRANVEFNEL